MLQVHNLDARRAKRILLTQALIASLTVFVAFAFGWTVGVSALLGGGTAVLANVLFAARVFGRYEARNPASLVARLYGAELFKLLFIVLVFAAAFTWIKPLNIVALFGAFLVVQVLPLLLANRVAP